MIRTVLTFVFNDKDQVLMIQKKRGQGTGKWNFPGGKCLSSESEIAASVRETKEETGIEPIAPVPVGKLEFSFDSGGSWANACTVFRTERWQGTLIPETDECSAHWIKVVDMPWDKMWDSDRTWVPLLLSGKSFHRKYHFDKNDNLLREEIIS